MKLTIEDLDGEDAEVEPFVVDLGDGQITLPAAQDIPSSLLVGLGSASELEVAERVLETGEWQKIMNHPSMTLRRVQNLAARYYEYLESSGLGDLGKSRASSTSSTGSARQSKRTSGSRRTGKAF